MKLFGINQFDKKSFLVYLSSIEKNNKDVLVCFDEGALTGDNIRQGHVCVVDRVYIRKGLVRLIDPSVNQPKWRIVNLQKLFKAMQVHGVHKSAGFWEFKKI